MRWPSPWGEGFPGWHIECSVMSTKYLGDEFDIHGGGLDLIFPHHECEIAQAEGAGKGFARVWMHWNMLTLEGEKMAKSKDHFVTLADLFTEFDPIVVRFHLLRAHYRSVSDFSQEALHSSAQGLRRLREAHRLLRERGGEGAGDDAALTEYREAFAAAMEDDLNTPQAIAALFDAVREVHARGDDAAPEWSRGAAAAFETLLEGALGVPLEPAGSEDRKDLLAGVVEMLLEQRRHARTARDFATADAIRNRLEELGVTVEDSAEGSRWRLS
jgi:cysteinyl-tRNA synthetase